MRIGIRLKWDLLQAQGRCGTRLNLVHRAMLSLVK
jgi:hypothetical protein